MVPQLYSLGQDRGYSKCMCGSGGQDLDLGFMGYAGRERGLSRV